MNNIKFSPQYFISVFLITATVLISLSTNAQDTIYLKSDKFISAKISEINPTNIKYKNYSNITGPSYTIQKNTVHKIVFENGDIEEYEPKSIKKQSSQDLTSDSKLFLTFSYTERKRNLPGKDAKKMLASYIRGKTSCDVVQTIEEADFVIELSLIKKFLSKRSAMIVIKNALTDKEIFKTKWVKSSSSVFYGLSGSRAAIGKLVKEHLLKEYPNL